MLDHIVLAAQDVQAAVEEIAAATGVRAELGGRFEGRGVYNHLLALQDGAYLEIIGPDPQQAGHEGALPFGMHLTEETKVAHWCAKAGCGDRAAGRVGARGGLRPRGGAAAGAGAGGRDAARLAVEHRRLAAADGRAGAVSDRLGRCAAPERDGRQGLHAG